VALASASGALLAASGPQALAAAGVGVLLLAAGSSALNQFQERDLDRLCARTCQRPLPSGALPPATALAVAILLLAGGFLVLASGATGYRSVLLAGLAVVLYNGLYTPLKRRHAIAILPGALAGALPPLIGAATAGTIPPAALLLAGAILVWQMPHSWLVQLRARDDGEHLALPAFCLTLSTGQLRRLVFTWSAAFAALPPVLLLLIGSHRGSPALPAVAIALSLLLTAAGVPLLGQGDGARLYRRLESLLRLTLLAFLALTVYANSL
jgi:protoheme IX farnesyltransferase